VPSYTLQQPQASPIVPPTTTRKVIAIIDPATGTALNTNPISLHAQTTTTTTTTVKDTHHHHHLDFVKAPHVSKAVSIVDPAIRDRELREKREREEEEERKKQEEEKARLEAERLEAERLEAERLEAERLEAERLEAEKKRLEEAAAEKKRLEQEAIETERLRQEAIAAAALAKAQEELERKLAEERESKRVISELEAEKKSRQVNGKVKMIDDIGSVQYPANLAHVPKAGEKHTYSIEFLLQFQQLCLDTNEDVLAIISKEMGDNNSSNNTTSRSNSMRQPSDRGKGSRSTGGNDMFRMGSSGRMEMGKFNMGRPLTARPPQQQQQQQMERQQSSHHGRGGSNMINRGRGGSGMKITRPQHPSQQGAPTIPMDQVVPLEKSENRWVPTLQNAAAPKEGELMSQEYITRKVNALLNKLTVEKFDSIAPQIFAYAHQSAKEEDGRSLRTVMKLTFEKACDEPAFASMWARLCRSMYDAMTDEIRDTSILDDEEKPSCGILLFRKYLFNRCQVEFEKGWKVNMPEVEEDMMTEEYYIAAKAKRQGLGLIQFIGELFKLEMLSERIMYSCMVKLCNNPLEAGDEEAESLCKLLATIGKVLDAKPKTEKWVDVVIKRMREEMIKSPKLSSRIRFMIQDLFDLRKDKWVPRIGGNQVGPTTIAKIHEMAEKAKEEKEALKRNNSSRGQYIPNNNQYNNTRTGSYRQKDYHSQVGQDGWSTVAQGASKTRVTNDLSNFGKTDRSRPRTNILGPSNSPFPSLTRGKSVTNIDTKNVTTTNDGRSSPATNMFSALLSDDQQQRKKLQLTPRATEAKEKLSEEEAKRKCKNILEEYFNIRDKKVL
jgi:translation initiation factor 4G